MYPVLLISRYIIDSEKRHGRGVSNLRLQKLLYFVQAHFLLTKHTPCFSEHIEAWDFGPVVPEAYHEYKFYGSSNIPTYGVPTPEKNFLQISNNDKKLIDDIVAQCARYTTSQLVSLTHNQEPWIKAHNAPLGNQISNESILKFFEG